MDATAYPEPARASGMANSIRAGVRSYLSIGMLRSAETFRDLAAAIEAKHAGVWASPHVEEHADLVMSSVLNSAMFLEAMVNELFADASEAHGIDTDGYLAPLDVHTIGRMGAWWKASREGFDETLEKYQVLLGCAGESLLDKGADPFQSAQHLVTLRNAIVHFKPSTEYSDAPHALEKRLAGKFPANGLLKPGSSGGWPHGVLGAGCAAWAVISAERLAEEVCARMGVVPAYQRTLRGRRP